MQDGGENSQFDWSEVGEIYEDIYYPKTRWEAEGFNRYFANATKTLQKGDKKNIILSVGNTVYFIEADGYMSGDIVDTMPILGKEEAVRAKREEFENATRVRNDRSGEIFDSWAGDISIRFSGSVSDNDGAANGSGANRIDAIYGSSQESDQIGYYRRSDTDNEGEWESAGQTENPVTLPGGAITNDPEVIEEYFRNIYEADSNGSAFSMPKNGDGSFSFSFDGNVSDETNTPETGTNTPETGNSTLLSDIHFQATERVKNGPQRTVAERVDSDKYPIIMSVKINGEGMYELENISSNFITSYYGKSNDFEGYINRAIDQNKILYINKEKSQNLYRLAELQLPYGFYKLGFDTIIHKSENVVNGYSMQDGGENSQLLSEEIGDTITEAASYIDAHVQIDIPCKFISFY